jgi:hypothetical protein
MKNPKKDSLCYNTSLQLKKENLSYFIKSATKEECVVVQVSSKNQKNNAIYKQQQKNKLYVV